MIATSILQNIFVEITTITGVNAAIYTSDGKNLISRGDISDINHELIADFVSLGVSGESREDIYLNRVNQGIDDDYICVVKKDSANAYMASRLITAQLESLIDVSRERTDKDSFIKNLLLDNLLQIDLYNRSRRLNIEFEEPRAVFVVNTDSQEFQPLHDVLRKFISDYERDFLAGTDENHQIIVHSLRDSDDCTKELENFSLKIKDAVNTAGIQNVSIAYGSKVDELNDIPDSYKEANFAHNVRSIFYEDRDIISYNGLGIGRLIYQLPINLCRLFINEIFAETNFDEFDDEILTTVNKFFENSLNVSESSRQLFIHRNTLVYRLDKIQKQTGLDLRVFDDAITFSIAMMVIKYMNYMENTDF